MATVVRCPAAALPNDWGLVVVTPADRSIVRQLYGADGAKRSAEIAIEDLIGSLFPDGWRGWNYHGEGHAAAIDVYQVVDSPAAATALQRSGWVSVTLHDHPAQKLLTCMCRPRVTS